MEVIEREGEEVGASDVTALSRSVAIREFPLKSGPRLRFSPAGAVSSENL
jgi:hypothetical protein